jgi:hypothetical protein
MKKSSSILLVAFLLSLFPLCAMTMGGSNDYRTLILSNELGATTGGGLIDRLIAAGHGSDSLYQVLLLLAAQPGSNIPTAFVVEVGNNPPGSEVFTATLSNFAGLNNPVGINGDGTLLITSIYGRDYEGDTGFSGSDTTITGVVRFRSTLANNSSYYIDTGNSHLSIPGQNYVAIGIVWSYAVRSFFLSNESPGFLIDKLVAAGHGNQNLYQVLQFLASQPGSGIPADFVAEVGSSPSTSDVFNFPLNQFADPTNNPIGISGDGFLFVAGLFGRDCSGQPGFENYNVLYPVVGWARNTMAKSPIHYIDAGSQGTSHGAITYTAIGVAWGASVAAHVNPISASTVNEWGMVVLILMLVGVSLFYLKG